MYAHTALTSFVTHFDLLSNFCVGSCGNFVLKSKSKAERIKISCWVHSGHCCWELCQCTCEELCDSTILTLYYLLTVSSKELYSVIPPFAIRHSYILLLSMVSLLGVVCLWFIFLLMICPYYSKLRSCLIHLISCCRLLFCGWYLAPAPKHKHSPALSGEPVPVISDCSSALKIINNGLQGAWFSHAKLYICLMYLNKLWIIPSEHCLSRARCCLKRRSRTWDSTTSEQQARICA